MSRGTPQRERRLTRRPSISHAPIENARQTGTIGAPQRDRFTAYRRNFSGLGGALATASAHINSSAGGFPMIFKYKPIVPTVAGAAIALAFAGTVVAAPFNFTLTPSTTISASTPPFGPGVGGATADEIDTAVAGDEASGGEEGDLGEGGQVVNRSIAKAVGRGRATAGNGKAKSNPELVKSFDGLNFFQQRFANGGNQFSVEPPDQALCVGNGFVLSSVNDVLRIWDTAGNAKTGAIDLNTFYGYAAAINRATGARGPSITDPVCLYDADTHRWFHVVLTLDHVGTTASLNGNNHLDIAVSTSADPTGTWVVYKLPVQNNGTQGTPDHHCSLGFCLGDYPHIGADANGIYLTTNEFSVFGGGFYGAQIYALSKHALANLAAVVPGVLINTGDFNLPSFTVWPAQSPGTLYDTANGGTEFLLSSLAVFEDSGESNQLLVYALTNTRSLNTSSPAIGFDVKVLGTQTYSVPPSSNQKTGGNTPLRDCLADTTTNCFSAIAGATGRFDNPLIRPDSNDSRMQQVFYANGKLWGALDTGVNIAGDVGTNGAQITRAGIAYFVLNPDSGVMFQQGIVALKGNNTSYPAIGVAESGRGIMAFTLMGDDHFPSAAYVALDAKAGAGDIHIAAEGAGPQDGFSGYRPFSTRPRWGDYGAAATDGNSIWFASEYIGQTCTYTQYKADPTCGGTRGALGNWGTRITQVK
jgi:hypothetical protein